MVETPKRKPQINVEVPELNGKGRTVAVPPENRRGVTVTNIPMDEFKKPLESESTHLRIPMAGRKPPLTVVDKDTKMFQTVIERNLALQNKHSHLPGKLEDNLRMLLSKKKSQ